MEYFREKCRSRDKTDYCRVQGCASRLAALSAVSRVHRLEPAALGKDPSASGGRKMDLSGLHHLWPWENSLSCSTGRFSQQMHSGLQGCAEGLEHCAGPRRCSLTLGHPWACCCWRARSHSWAQLWQGRVSEGQWQEGPACGWQRVGPGSTGPGSCWHLPQLCGRSWHHLHPSKGKC